MHFTESKKRGPWVLLILLFIIIVGVLMVGFCGMTPTPKTVQKTIVFEAD